MQREQPRPRGGTVSLTFDAKLENEEEILDGLLLSLSRGQLSPDTWAKFHMAAVRDDRLAELAFAYENTAQSKRIKTMTPAVVAEFLFRASTFFSDAMGDELGAVSYLERALAAMPTHAASFERVEQLLAKAGNRRKLADLCASIAAHRPRGDQVGLLRRAAMFYEADGASDDKVIEVYQQILRLEPQDEQARTQLENRYLKANRHRDVARLLEQALTVDPPPSEEYAFRVRARLVELYAGQLHEPERSIPHVEAILVKDPSHDEARRVARKLLEVKGLAARAASALAAATEQTGTPSDVAKLLAIELEHTRGPKRRDVLRKLGVLRQDRMGDAPGAYEAFEGALALDPSDDDMRRRYAALAKQLHKELDAARTLSRVGTAAKEPALRSRLSAEVGELYLAGGDAKRAKASFVGVMAQPDLEPGVSLLTARSLCQIYAAEKDYPALGDALEKVALHEPDPELRQIANEELAQLALGTLKDTPRAIAAYKRLLDTPARREALAALEPLFEAAQDTAELALVLEERAKDVTDPTEARRLAFRAAEVLASTGDASGASAAWQRLVDKFGAARDVHERWIPLLEGQRQWAQLSNALEADARLAPETERAGIYARLGTVRLQRTREVPAAIDAFQRALAADRAEKSSRSTLEKLLAIGDHRMEAARVLEPIYREERATAGLLKVLDVRATLASELDGRLSALEEAVTLAEQGGGAERTRALDFAGRGLLEAVTGGRPLTRWLEAIERFAPGTDAKKRAGVLTKALGERVVDSPAMLDLARRTGEALAASGETAAALEVYRRGLAFEPTSADLIMRVDDLLRDQGDPHERIALYRAALERGPDVARRRELLHRIGTIQRQDVGDSAAAIETFRRALEDDPTDREAHAALVELYSAALQWDALCTLLEGHLSRVSGEEAVRTRLQLADVAASNGQSERAAQHVRALLAESALASDELDAVGRIAEAIGELGMQREALSRRAMAAEDPREQAQWLDKLATLDFFRGDPETAVAGWKRAAQLSEKGGDDEQARRLYERVREVAPQDPEAALRLADLLERAGEWSTLPDLFAVLLEAAQLPSARVAVLMRRAKVLAEHLDDAAGALASAAQAFELSTDNDRREVLSTFTHLALLGKGTQVFANAMDQAIAKLAGGQPDLAAQRADLAMAKARVLAANREGRDGAAAAYRTVLDDPDVDEARIKAALLAFESLLTSDPSEARLNDRRWLLSWRADHAPEGGLIPALLAWATAEESTFGDHAQALELYKRALALDVDNAEVMASVARLSLALGDTAGAINALVARRDRSEGAARNALDLEIATILIERADRPRDAIAPVAAVLATAPQDDTALSLAVRLLSIPGTHADAIVMLEKALDAAEDLELRVRILHSVLDTPTEPPDPRELRRRWFERLLDLYRGQGRADLALETALAAARELPTVNSLWDRAEELARELARPHEVAELYHAALAEPLPRDSALALGERAVAFHEEWFEDSAGVVRILERVLEIDPGAAWAFDRLKLLFDAAERWDDLFVLFDRAIASAEDDERRTALLEDAAQVAKDFANNSDRAIGYLEQLLALRPGNARLVASLERLYERHGSHRELITLLSSQLPSLSAEDAQRARVRIALLWLDEIGDAASALAVAEEILAQPKRAGVDIFSLLEKVLAAAPAHVEARESVAPPVDGEHKRRDSVPVKSKRLSVRQRAAALLRELYTEAGREADLVRILEIELEGTKSVKEQIRRHRQIAALHAKLGNDAAASEHYAALVLLEPDVANHRAQLGELAEKVGRFDRLAEVLATAAEDCDSDPLRVELLMQAAEVHATRLRDAGRAIDLFLRVLALPDAVPEAALEAARRAEPLLEAAGRSWERLDVLERIAELMTEPDARAAAWRTAALLATELGENGRAIVAWEARLREGEDAEALDGLAYLLDKERRWERLIEVLTQRAATERSEDERRADRVRIARLYENELDAVDKAIDSWTYIEKHFGESDESLDALAVLLRKAERWRKLAGLLDRGSAAAQTPERRAVLLYQLGDLQRLQLSKFDKAVASYDAALLADPRCEGARTGLRALLSDPAHRAAAVDVLIRAFTATDEWRLTLELTEHRLASSADARARVRVLREVAQVAEDRGKDQALAFHAMRRALLDVPDDAQVEGELGRLAEATGEWRAYAGTYREILERAEEGEPRDAQWKARMRARLGELLETRLDDPEGALSAYLKAALEAPSEADIAKAAIRAGGKVNRWDAVARAVVDFACAVGRCSEDLLASVEAAAQGPGAWDAATSTLALAVAAAHDLPPSVARDLEARIGAWHRDKRGDPEAAEAAFARALAHDNLNAELLSSLAQIQRRAKGRPLIDSLLRLSQATGGDMDLLREAAEIAMGTVADRALAKSILESLMRLAKERWIGDTAPTVPSSGAPDAPGTITRWALEHLVRIHGEEGNSERTVDLLVDTARLPFDREVSRAMIHRAAKLCRETLGDVDRAIVLYGALFDEDPHDEEAVRALVALYEAESRHGELLALRRRQIASARSPAERSELRLAAAALLSQTGDSQGCVDTLRDNLLEHPRHTDTVFQLLSTLERGARHAELATLLAEQAELAEKDGEAVAAADLWARAAVVAEERLHDTRLAVAHHKRVAALEMRPSSYDALARLSAAHGDHADAAQYLEKLRAKADPGELGALTLRLADALAASGQRDLAQTKLEEVLAQSPQAEAVRERLARAYRDAERWDALADLLSQGAAHAPDKAARLSRLLEAADLYTARCNKAEAAVPLLEQASDLEPDNRATRLALADALGAAGRFADARTLLRALVDSFAGRRPKERAPVHYHLARLELAMGDRARALVELDAATRIDPANPRILRALAELARDDGQLDRAERSYRALLVALKRPEEAEEGAPMARTEVLLELSAIAERQNELERSKEILESALETAAKSDFEARSLERALRERGDYATLVRALEARLQHIGNVPDAAPVLAELALVLDDQLGHVADAFVARLRAVSLIPDSKDAHAAALTLARRSDGVRRYADEVDKLCATAEDAGNLTLAADLLLRLGTVVEGELRDDARAAKIYERARELELGGAREHQLAILRALDHVYERLGDEEAQARVLALRIDAEPRERDPHSAADALYRFAALKLASPSTLEEGCDRLEAALTIEPDLDRAVTVLGTAAAAHPDHERVLLLYEKVARAPGHEPALVDALSRRAEHEGGSGDAYRDAVEVAKSIGDGALAEALLRRFIERARAESRANESGWALASLAELREAAGDVVEAIALKREAAEVSDIDVARRLRFQIARLASESLGDLSLAAETYEGVLTHEAADREAWEPLLDVYRRMHDSDKLVRLLGKVVDYVDDNAERSRLRLERVRVMMEEKALGDDAAGPLREIVEDDPSHVEAALLLAEILERTGKEEELSELLARQIDAAKDRSDAASVGSLSLRLAARLEKKSRIDARSVLYGALEWQPESREILLALARLHAEDDEVTDRADVLERLLPLETGEGAEKLALELAQLRTDFGDPQGAQRALEIGHKVHPASKALTDKLERTYRESSAWDKLAELYARSASAQSEPKRKVALLRQSATIHRKQLDDPAKAAELLREARVALPDDFGLLEDLVTVLDDAHEVHAAIAELTTIIEQPTPSLRDGESTITRNESALAPLLARRAALRAELGERPLALEDMEAAFKLGGERYAHDLVLMLGQLRKEAAEHGDVHGERSLRLRLAEVLPGAGDIEGARSFLGDLLKQNPKDRDALRLLARIEENAGHWDAVTATYRRLVALEEGSAVVETALRLADACQRVNRPTDARGALERARLAAPENEALRARLQKLYEETGAFKELAEMSLADAKVAKDVGGRFAHLVRAGALFVQHAQDPAVAVAALEEARALRPSDMECTVLLADAYTLAGRTNEAVELINAAIASHKGRRSRELAALYHRLARVAHLAGDTASEVAWLSSALDMDGQNGFVASELATIAMETMQLDIATRALRAITMLKPPVASSISKAQAYQHLGEIARQQGDTKRAIMLLKRAVDDDPSLVSARALLDALQNE